MQRLSLLLAFLFTYIFVNAQEIPVEVFYQSMTDVSASTEPRIDNNGTPCALIKVESNWKDIAFEGNVSNVVYLNGIHWVYMPAGSKKMKLSIENYLPKTITFSDYKIKKLESNATYVLKVPITKVFEIEIVKQKKIKKEQITVTDTVHKQEVVKDKVFGGTEYYTVPSYFSLHTGARFVKGSEKKCYGTSYFNTMPRIGIDYTWVLNHFLSFRIGFDGGMRLPLHRDEDDHSEVLMQPSVDIPLMIGIYKAFGSDYQNDVSLHLGYIPNVEFDGLFSEFDGETFWESCYGLDFRLGLNKLLIGSSFVFGGEVSHFNIYIGYRF